MAGLEGWLTQLTGDRPITFVLWWGNYLIAVGFAYSELRRSRTSQGSIAWLLSLLLLPFPTTIIYMVFGLKLFDDYAALQTHSGRALRRTRAGRMSILDQPTSADWPVLANVAQIPFLSGNDAKLLIDGDAIFKSMLDGISRAERSIIAQFYIIRDDEIGRQFADRLIERARAGVDVHLLYDDVGSFWLPRRYKDRLRAAGIKVSGFNHRHRILRILGPTRLNYRNHRKVVVVDEREAWVGGVNVADEYLGRVKRFGPWRDTHVHVRGPAALAVSLAFREDWQWATGEAMESATPAPPKPAGDQSILVLPTGPADKLEDCAIAFAEVIARAEERLWIVSPYFVPDIDMQVALYAAAMRGVEVRILVPERPDHLLVWLASVAHTGRMIDHNIEIWRYPLGFLHEKVILVDDKLAGIGTVNFDNRSFRINFEITLWFTHPRMLKEIETMLIHDFTAGRKFTVEDRKAQPFALRLAAEAARLFSPVL